MKVKVYRYYQDPSHGWIAVKFDELVKLGIESNISHFSYRKGKTVYLEEDQDASTWAQAYQRQHGFGPSLNVIYKDGRASIRNYPSYDLQEAQNAL